MSIQRVRWDFYPRSPCGERLCIIQLIESGFIFLSTLSLRRATCVRCFVRFGPAYFYPRSPCGERPDMAVSYSKGIKISIHALLAESDFFKPNKSRIRNNFYPRSPCGERRASALYNLGNSDFYPRSPCGERLNEDRYGQQFWRISIHALLAESDFDKISTIRITGENFYPRSPCGERLMRYRINAK